ncbi:MAG: hypothetical protein OJF49_000033 [Ktedonobacterales bacterium]|nr:MAG: hypothetical protein OJF49_000033 [Ktedonobacterales bacterium]
MDNITGISSSNLLRPLLIGTLIVLVLLAWLAQRSPHLVRIGLRSVGRRRARTVLIILGLMLSTTFVASAFAVDNTITTAVKSIAVFSLGRIDEDVVGSGSLRLYPAHYGQLAASALDGNPHVAGVAPSLVISNLLVADETARQVRGGVTAVAMDGSQAGTLGALEDVHGRLASVNALGSEDAYLNATTGALLNAQPGDVLYLYSTKWPGHRYQFTLRAIVTGGPLGDSPAIVLPLTTLQNLLGAPNHINHIYIANTGDGLTGVSYSDDIANQVNASLPAYLYVREVKADGVKFALRAQDIFGRILTLYTLFALALGLMLIFLIFVLLAAERRSELGMVRALGMRRNHIVGMLLFEGAAYDTAAAAIGMLSGLGLGVLIVMIVSPTLTQIGFPLKIAIDPESMLVSFCLGALFTMVTIWLAAWSVSRMTVAAALRDLEDPPRPDLGLAHLLRALMLALRDISRWPFVSLDALGQLVWGITVRGIVPLTLGWVLLRLAEERHDILLLSLGVSCVVVGGVLLLRWLGLFLVLIWMRVPTAASATRVMYRAHVVADRFAALLIGGGIALYWSLPFDVFGQFGAERFTGGIATFFVAGVMMVFGAVWAIAPNLDLLLIPVRWLFAVLRHSHVTRIALVYPSQQRFRTGIGLALFSLVCFTMVVMACIAASTTHTYDTVPAQASGYDVAGQPLFTPVGDSSHVRAVLGRSNALNNLATISSATPLPLGILQPGAPNARWSLYPVSQVDGGFLDGVGLPLVARALGYTSDADVWQALRTHPGDVVIDTGALSGIDAARLSLTLPPSLNASTFLGSPIASGLPGLSSLEAISNQTANASDIQQALPEAGAAISDPDFLREVTLRLRNVALSSGVIAPTPLWVSDLRGGKAIKLTLIGIVENVHGERQGMFGSAATFAPVEQGLSAFGNEYFFFKTKPGVDVHAEALTLGSALLDHGFETTVLQDVLLDVNGPQVFISRVLVGLVGLTLLVGTAALAVTGSRAVVERRQQIGMMRALGFRRAHVQAIFLIESLLVGMAGTILGLILGLALCRNLFAVNFFAQYRSGLTLIVPSLELAAICAAAIFASSVAALLPAWQAGRIAPADALRYE